MAGSNTKPAGRARHSVRAVPGQPADGAHGVKRPTGKFWLLLLLLLSTINSQLSTAHAQSYSIDWHTIDGGGGTSTGSVYSISGTIGQPDAGKMSGGNFTVDGGFWGIIAAVQTPGAPLLTIAPATPGNATISWTPNTPGFVLQETLNLSPTNWVNSSSGATNPIVVPASVPTKFYRLFKP